MEKEMKLRQRDDSAALKQQVPSLFRIKELARLGWDSPTLFEVYDEAAGIYLQAPTAAELMEILPKFEMAWRSESYSVDGVCSYYCTNRFKGSSGYSTLADALADSWIRIHDPEYDEERKEKRRKKITQ